MVNCYNCLDMVIGDLDLCAICRNTALHQQWVRMKRQQFMMVCDSFTEENEMLKGEIAQMFREGVLDKEVQVNSVNIYSVNNNNNNNNNSESDVPDDEGEEKEQEGREEGSKLANPGKCVS